MSLLVTITWRLPPAVVQVSHCWNRSHSTQTRRKVVSLPPFLRLNDFSKRLGLQKDAVLQHVGAKRERKKIWWSDPLTGRSFVFEKLNQFVLPFATMEWFVRHVLNTSTTNSTIDVVQDDMWERTLRPLPDASCTEEGLTHRHPVVAVLGHIDHGKTTIIDALRGTNVAEREAGGITQAIGAFRISLRVRGTDNATDTTVDTTFLDTPGHAHFFQMREDSTRVATAALLVVACDEPELRDQTKESISCLADMNVPVVVVINKIDMENASPQHTKRLLEEYGLIGPEGPMIGGKKPVVVEISAKEKTNLVAMEHELAKAISQQDLFAYGENHAAEGIVIEASNTRSKGALLRIVLSAGILRVGQPYVSGNVVGIVKSMYGESGKETIKEARPGQVVYVAGSLKGVGLSEVPPLGEPFFVLKDRKEAEKMREYRSMIQVLAGHQTSGPPLFLDSSDHDDEEAEGDENFQDMSEVVAARNAQIEEEDDTVLPVIVKAETAGKLDALIAALTESQCARPVRISVGPLEVGDVQVAAEEKVPLISYGLKVTKQVLKAANEKEVPIVESLVMYDILQDIMEYAKKRGY